MPRYTFSSGPPGVPPPNAGDRRDIEAVGKISMSFDGPASGTSSPRRILGLAGSLRHHSHNKALLRAAARLAPEPVTIEVYDGLETVPVFNEDLEGEGQGPPGVVKLRRQVLGADGLLIATPEYNQSVPGVVKNMVDWLSRGEGLSGHPVAVIGASTGPWGTRLAQVQLRQMLLSVQTMVMPAPTLFIPNVESLLDARGEISDPVTLDRLESVVIALTEWIELIARPPIRPESSPLASP